MSSKRNSLVLQSTGILTLSLILALVYNAFSPKGIALLREPPKTITVPDSALFGTSREPVQARDSVATRRDTTGVPKEFPAPVTTPERHRDIVPSKSGDGLMIVTLAQFEKILAAKKALIIDARNPDEFDRGHIEGAKNIPFMQIENHFEALLGIPRDTMIVVYCSDPDCPLARELVKFMQQMEFGQLLLFDEGWDGWIAAGKGERRQ